MQKPSKIDQQSSKNGPKISLGGVSGGPWGLLAAKIEKTRMEYQLLGPLGAILGPSWGPLGTVLALGSPSWGVLGRHGALLSRLKIDVKIDLQRHRFFHRFWHGFLDGPRRRQDRPRRRSKRQDGPKRRPRKPQEPPKVRIAAVLAAKCF